MKKSIEFMVEKIEIVRTYDGTPDAVFTGHPKLLENQNWKEEFEKIYNTLVHVMVNDTTLPNLKFIVEWDSEEE